MSVKGRPRSKQVMLGKHTLEVYSIGFLAMATDLANVTLRLWERKGILPKPILTLPGMRYYTAPELLKYAALISEHYVSGRDLKKLRALLHGASVQVRDQLKRVSTSPTCPMEVLCLHLPPQPRWNHEIAK